MSRQIGFLFIDGYALMSSASAVEPLRAANLLAGDVLYEPVFLSVTGGAAVASCGASFPAVPLAETPAECDLVFVVAGGNPLVFPHRRAVYAYLRSLAARGVSLGGISGGGVILAEAGVMEGRRFTVHWEYIETVRESSDNLLIERRLYVIDRDRYTCAGGAAPLDMMHTLIAADHSAELAREVSDWFIHTGVRAAEDPQRAGLVEKYGVQHPAVLSAIELMESHIADPLSLEQIASLSGLGSRQLQRLFETKLGQTVMRFYRDMRLEKADDLVRQSPLPVVEIAVATGFADAGHFAKVYRDRFGMTPSERRT